MKRRFERYAQFWEVEQAGKVVTVRWGTIDKGREVKEHRFHTPAAAVAEAERLIAAKVTAGFVDKSPPASTPPREAGSVDGGLAADALDRSAARCSPARCRTTRSRRSIASTAGSRRSSPTRRCAEATPGSSRW